MKFLIEGTSLKKKQTLKHPLLTFYKLQIMSPVIFSNGREICYKDFLFYFITKNQHLPQSDLA